VLASQPSTTVTPASAEPVRKPSRPRATLARVVSRPALIRPASMKTEAASTGEPSRGVRRVEQRNKLRLVGPSQKRAPSGGRQ
jgi:hypothetical protein